MLDEIVSQIRVIEENSLSDGGESIVSSNLQGNVLNLQMNELAIVELCRQLLDLARSGIDGKHCHLDGVSFIDIGDAELTVILKNDWTELKPQEHSS
ncbi:hypothetical protein FGU71_03580 [Erythrobacter insulae]|uniref:Uncharacterized protein n=1 Tax=Erythrobacter insulae TaxID=2584124 RepID=A0A547PA41_9SPHN|nr:hypothetical protein [Erythrobacter insulae]TRD11020.1 hypothetical protein FGU71_03580 [Erythrobacter insulae]